MTFFSKVAVGSYVMAAVARDRFGAGFFCPFFFWDSPLQSISHTAHGFKKLEALAIFQELSRLPMHRVLWWKYHQEP